MTQALDAKNRSDRVTILDEGVLYAAIATALATAPFAAGVGGGSLQLGVVGVTLVIAGTLLSWRMRDWGWKGVLVGAPLGLAAAAAFNLLVERDLVMDDSPLNIAQGELGLMLAIRMAILPIIFSFILIKYDIIAFSLVPALATFGLVGGQGDVILVAACFAIFLPASLVALGHGMLLTGLIRAGGRSDARWRLGNWRGRHWAGLASAIILILGIAYALFFPISYYVSKYRWQFLTRVSVGGIPARQMMPPRQMRERNQTALPVGRGPISLGHTPILTIWGPPSPLWRGRVFDYFTGQAWIRSEAPSEEEEGAAPDPNAPPAPVVRLPTNGAFDFSADFPRRPGAPLESHLVRVEAGIPAVIYSPGQVDRLAGRNVESLSPLRIDAYGCVEAPGRSWRSGSYYEVVSSPLDIRGRPTAPSLSPVQLPGVYLRVNPGAGRVADLAREIAGGEPSPERKLMALVGYIQRNYIYTLTPPTTPLGEDAAEFFLFESQRGYCDLFATSLAVMARAVGIPTRVVDGFAYGSEDPAAQTLRPRPDNPTGPPEPNFQMTEADAHTWVEAYVQPWGWVSVDATPAAGESPIPPLRRSVIQVRILFHDHPSVPLVIAGALIAGIIGFAIRLRGMRLAIPRLAAGGVPPSDARYAVIRAYAQSLLFLRRLGHARRLSQTPLEYLDHLRAATLSVAQAAGVAALRGAAARDLPGPSRATAQHSDRQGAVTSPRPRRRFPLRGRSNRAAAHLAPMYSALPAIAALTELFLRARYSPAAVTDAAAATAAQHLRSIRRALR